MPSNRINAEIPQTQEKQIIEQIKTLKDSLEFLVNLPSKERIRLAKLSRSQVDFVDSALVYMRSNPEYVPNHIKIEEMEKDVSLSKSLSSIQAVLDSFSDKIKDTSLLADADAYSMARLFYKAVKAASKEGLEDAERIANDLSYHFKKMGNPGSTNDKNETATAVAKETGK